MGKRQMLAFDCIEYSLCGGYHGEGNRRYPSFKPTLEQIAYGNYCYLFLNAFAPISDDKLDDPAFHATFNMFVAMIENYVLNECVDYARGRIEYSEEKFKQHFSGMYVEFARERWLDIIAGQVRTALPYILMKKGIRYKQEDLMYDNTAGCCCSLSHKNKLGCADIEFGHAPVNTEEVKKSIDDDIQYSLDEREGSI